MLHQLKLSPEQRILFGIHGVSVHLEQIKVDPGNSLHEALEGGVDLELFEETSNDTSSGGSGEPDLVVDNDWSVDVGSDQSLADCIEIYFIRSSRVTDGDSDQLPM